MTPETTDLRRLPDDHHLQREMKSPLLRATDVSFSYNGRASVLNGVSFSLMPGSLTGLVGPNGAGKTTLVRLIHGELAPTSGTISFSDPWAGGGRQRSVAVVEQHLSLFPDLSVAANISIRQRATNHLTWVKPADLCKDAHTALDRLGVQLDLSASVGALPYPAQQMVEIARAAHEGARLLILDEPTAGLDVPSRNRLFNLLHSMVSSGISVLLVTHDMADLRGIADAVLGINNGRLVPVAVATEITHTGDAAISDSNDTRDLDITVRLACAKRFRLFGRRGSTVLWHFEDAAERSLVARAIAFGDLSSACSIQIDGRRLSNTSTSALRSHGIRLLLTDRRSNGLFPQLTVLQNYCVVSGAKIDYLHGSTTRNLALKALQEGEIQFHSLDAPAFTLSGGNQQRLLWAALANSDAQFIIAEEPLWGLDDRACRATIGLMRDMNNAGRGVVILTCAPRAYPGHLIHVPERLEA